MNILYLDLDKDGKNETAFRIQNSKDITNYFVPPYDNTTITVGKGDIYAPDIQFASELDETGSPRAKLFSLSQTIDDSDDLVYKLTYYPYLAYHRKLPDDIKEGDFLGLGEKFIGFKIKIDSDYHYGWIKVNLTTDLKLLEVVRSAYNLEPDKEIKAGEQ